ncbi:putative macrophage stimulating 1-like protein [Haliotis cracherodii]|uniref:putative macrophage stimulating 1-like protein n=1 Tax=Haliotis cracherodii TaxID=6455 RepID=UPI0039E96809
MAKVTIVVAVMLLWWTQVSMACTELSERLSSGVFQKLRVLRSTYVVLSSHTQYHCAMQCMYDAICASFNYDTTTSSCELNTETSTTTPDQVVNTPGWINANADSFPQALIGSCAGHTCPRGSICTLGTAQCIKRWRCVQIENGKVFYGGIHNVTREGRTCQRWDSHTPQQHYGKNDSPNNMQTVTSMAEAGNRCLTEFNDTIPWCYTTDPAMRWEHCSIPTC